MWPKRDGCAMYVLLSSVMYGTSFSDPSASIVPRQARPRYVQSMSISCWPFRSLIAISLWRTASAMKFAALNSFVVRMSNPGFEW